MGYIKNIKQVLSRKLHIMACLLLVLSVLCGCGEKATTSSKETIRILSEFTTITKEKKDIYAITYEAEDADENDWAIRCTDANNAIRIYDYEACRILINYGLNAFRDYYFSYDFDEKRASFYLDSDAYGISIVSYMIADDEFVLNTDDGPAVPSEEFESFLRDNDLIDIIKYDIEVIEDQLGGYGISYADVNNISINDLADY